MNAICTSRVVRALLTGWFVLILPLQAQALDRRTRPKPKPRKIEKIPAVVEKIVDGDTIWAQVEDDDRSGGKKRERVKVRMVGMDAPETHLAGNGGIQTQGKYGEEATELLESLVPVGTPITLDVTGNDMYGRVLGRIYLGKRDINLALVEAGLAIPYLICEGTNCDKTYSKREKVAEYLAACDDARAKGKGIFDPKDPLDEMPFEFRLRIQKRDPDKYVGDYKTQTYVEPEDYDEVDLCKRIFFFKEKDAENAGYRPVERSRKPLTK